MALSELPANLGKLKVVQLRAALKERGLPHSGKKADLVARLEAHAAEAEGEAGGSPDEAAAAVAAPAAEELDDSLHLQFDFVDVEEEKGILTNRGEAEVALVGFTVTDLSGGNSSAPFKTGRIAPGKSITIWTCPGKGKGLQEDDSNVFWRNQGNGKPRSANVLNDDGDGLKLLNASGQTVATGLGARSLHLQLLNVDVEAEKATLVNGGKEDLDLAGFSLADLDGGNTSAPFGAGTALGAGQSATLWTAPGKVAGLAEDSSNLWWRNRGDSKPRKQEVLNNKGDGIRLLNPAGATVATGLGAAVAPSDAPEPAAAMQGTIEHAPAPAAEAPPTAKGGKKRKADESEPPAQDPERMKKRRWRKSDESSSADKAVSASAIKEILKETAAAAVAAPADSSATDEGASASPSEVAGGAAGEPAQGSVPEHRTTILHITNFLRPFTNKAVRELLNENGTLVDTREGFAMDTIKSQCYAQFGSVDEAVATYKALHGRKWPVPHGKILACKFVETNRLRSGGGDAAGASAADRRGSSSAKQPDSKQGRRKSDARESGGILDSLFRRTKTKPSLFWLPLSSEEVAAKKKAAEEALERRRTRARSRSRSWSRSRSRSPPHRPGRRSSPSPRRRSFSPRRGRGRSWSRSRSPPRRRF